MTSDNFGYGKFPSNSKFTVTGFTQRGITHAESSLGIASDTHHFHCTRESSIRQYIIITSGEEVGGALWSQVKFFILSRSSNA